MEHPGRGYNIQYIAMKWLRQLSIWVKIPDGPDQGTSSHNHDALSVALVKPNIGLNRFAVAWKRIRPRRLFFRLDWQMAA